MQTSTVIGYSPMDPYSGSYRQPPAMDGHSSPGYQQAPASFSGHSTQEDSAEGYQYHSTGSAYQAQPPTYPQPSSHRYQGGGLLQTQYNGPRSPLYGHAAGYGATTSVSRVCLRWPINTVQFAHFRSLLQGAVTLWEFPLATLHTLTLRSSESTFIVTLPRLIFSVQFKPGNMETTKVHLHPMADKSAHKGEVFCTIDYYLCLYSS